MKQAKWCGFLIATLAIVGPASGTTVQFEFSGTVEVVADNYGDLDGIVEVGDPYIVWYTFDTSALDQLPEDPTRAIYGGVSAQLILPTWEMEASAPVLSLTHLDVNDHMGFSAGGSAATFTAFLGSGGGILSSDGFPWPIPAFSEGFVQVYWAAHSSTKFWGAITAFPEPSATVLALLGGGIVFGRRRVRF